MFNNMTWVRLICACVQQQVFQLERLYTYFVPILSCKPENHLLKEYPHVQQVSVEIAPLWCQILKQQLSYSSHMNEKTEIERRCTYTTFNLAVWKRLLLKTKPNPCICLCVSYQWQKWTVQELNCLLPWRLPQQHPHSDEDADGERRKKVRKNRKINS